jgi:excisionase family DNA binding protein
MQKYFNRKQAAQFVGVSPRTILRAIKSNQLVAVKIGEGKTSPYIFEREALKKYKAKRKSR